MLLALLLASVIAWGVLVGLPGQINDDDFSTKGVTDAVERATIEEKRLKSRNDIRTAGAQLLAALAVLGGGFDRLQPVFPRVSSGAGPEP